MIEGRIILTPGEGGLLVSVSRSHDVPHPKPRPGLILGCPAEYRADPDRSVAVRGLSALEDLASGPGPEGHLEEASEAPTQAGDLG